jgi:hypothetical protein
MEMVLERFGRFVQWAETVDAMQGYFASPDSLWAIAQHYGLQTNFIDFSSDPRVAAFFACDNKAVSTEGQSATIICLNSEDFLRFWKDVGPAVLKGLEERSYPHLIRIDVDNLWRLQKQKGCFLWNPVRGIERFYDFDRIVFPCVNDDAALPKREEIYPVHQSELEKLLTQFFMNEQMREGNKVIASLNMPTHTIEASEYNYDAISWYPTGISVTTDWLETDAWQKRQVEHSDFILPGTRIELDPSRSLEELSGALRLILSPAFIDTNREKALDIQAHGNVSFDRDCASLFVCIRRLWNGMRNLPYTASEIYTALAETLKLFPRAQQGTSDRDVLGEDSIYVEMASNADGRGAYSRGTVSREALIEAFNPAFLRAARETLQRYNPDFRNATDPFLARAFLQLPSRPWERFTFTGLQKLMTEQLIPTQIVWRVSPDDYDLRTVIYFSPKEFKVFGLV